MITPKDFAEQRGVKPVTVRLWIRLGKIPFEQITLPNGDVRYLVPANAPLPDPKRGPKGLSKEEKIQKLQAEIDALKKEGKK